ncbi:MAG: polysaccharide biosynthesis protein [Lachnospiraceae bacterium]|nr:polysaccharide biosynthesis protein [Lachnospiraceae bacterium]
MKNVFKDNRLFIRRLFLVVVDIMMVGAASVASLLLRFNLTFESIQEDFFENMISYLPIQMAVTVVVFFLFKLYSSIWTFASINELENVIIACAISSGLYYIGLQLISPWIIPRSCYLLYFMCITAFVGATRFGYRAIKLARRRVRDRKTGNNVMIVGAGEAANMIIREMIANEDLRKTISCVLDDDVNKIGNYIQGIKVVGTTDEIPRYVEKYNINEIIIAIPSAKRERISSIINIAKTTECALKILPGIREIVEGEGELSKVRNVEVEDLLGRDPIEIDLDSIMGYVVGKTALVTGGGGSIGSEICRQLAGHGVGRLIIVDIYENNAYDIQQELKITHPELDLVVLIASVRNTLRIKRIFEEYRPNIVFHAAAHKHVPLMEVSPNEAIKNNVFGTLKTVRAADESGVEKFVLISTDKAVNPTNIMGATKRLCEMIVQTYNKRSNTEFVAVRFGNVLGSNGSVIPLFKRQIEEGGPVTVTHPDIIRYFMTIPEAVSLVLQAGAYAKGGEIFVLDMGEPVKILDLAENMIRLSGYVPYRDIDIKFTGLRPGEKLYEELLMKEEGMRDTANKLIFIGRPIEIDEEKFLENLSELYRVVLTEPDNIRTLVKKLVPTYKPNTQG